MNNKGAVVQVSFVQYWKEILCNAWSKSWKKLGMLGILFPAVVSFLFTLITGWGKPLTVILGEHWMLYGFIFLLSYFVVVGFFILKEPVIVHNKVQKDILDLKDEIQELKSIFPNVAIGECRKDNMLVNINRYGANSLLCKNLHSERILLYIDFINSPKIKNNNSAIDVSVYLKYYDENGESVNRKHFGRWMEMPETVFEKHVKVNIPSDGRTSKRLGIGYFDKGGNGMLILLDAEVTDLNEYGMLNSQDIQYLDAGKYFVVANISGNNVQNTPSLLFKIEIEKDGKLKFEQDEHVDEFLEKISENKKERSKLWN